MENRFEKFTKAEEAVGAEFACIFNTTYEKANTKNKFAVDGKIDDTTIELQELRSKFFIGQDKLCIDTVSIFYFNAQKRKKITLNDNDINVVKLGKLFTLSQEAVYLIYINKSNISNISKYSNFIIGTNYVYIPLNVALLQNLVSSKYHNVNNKRDLADTWESAYITISLNDAQDCLDYRFKSI